MKKIVFSYGRMNPPTIGHEKLVEKVKKHAEKIGADHEVIMSHSQDAKKNPLSPEQKLKHARRAFPHTNLRVSDKEHPTFLQHVDRYAKAGYKHITMVAGSDRVDEYKEKLHKYKPPGVEVHVESAGRRDPDAEGAEGMSASKMREHAKNKNLEHFKQGVPSHMSHAHASELYHDVRNGMGLHEEYVEEAKDHIEKMVDKISDDELHKHVEKHYKDVLSEEDVDEANVLNLTQRMARARRMRRSEPKLQRMRQAKRLRMADNATITRRARKLAVLLLKKRVAGQRGLNYSTLSPSEKMNIDRLVAPRLNLVGRIAERLLPFIRRKEMSRLKQARGGTASNVVKPNIVAQYDPSIEEKTEVRQDSDIKHRQGTQPAKYYTGLSASTKAARDAQFKRQAKMSSQDLSAYKPAPGDDQPTKLSKYTVKYRKMFGEEINEKFLSYFDEEQLTEKAESALRVKAQKSGVSYGTLKKVFDRGVAAWRTGHRPGTTPQQWGFARVNSFITKGKTYHTADKDLTDDVDLHHLEATMKTLSGVRENKDSADFKIVIDKDGNKRKVRAHEIEFHKEEYAPADLNESFAFEYGAGVGVTMFAKDHGITIQGSFEHHPEVEKELEEKFDLPRLGSNPGKFKRLVAKHLGAAAADKIDRSDGERIMSKAKKSNNTQLYRQGSFIRNFYGKKDD